MKMTLKIANFSDLLDRGYEVSNSGFADACFDNSEVVNVYSAEGSQAECEAEIYHRLFSDGFSSYDTISVTEEED
jgi:hypothetical protein